MSLPLSAPDVPAAANNTYWNIYPADRDTVLYQPDCEFGPLLNFVGASVWLASVAGRQTA